jgi:hypothetical protein
MPAQAVEDEVSTAKQQLNRELELIEQITPYVERLDLARLDFLKRKILAVRGAIEAKGLAHMATITAYQELIVSFRYSVAFFRQIRTTVTENGIAELLKINDTIIAARGFDDTPYTKITAGVFDQIHKLVLQLGEGPLLSEGLKAKVNELIVPIGRAIAEGRAEGDRPETFQAGTVAYCKILSLYPDFDRVQRSDAGFDVVLEIQGLSEFYAEFAQIRTCDGIKEK